MVVVVGGSVVVVVLVVLVDVLVVDVVVLVVDVLVVVVLVVVVAGRVVGVTRGGEVGGGGGTAVVEVVGGTVVVEVVVVVVVVLGGPVVVVAEGGVGTVKVAMASPQRPLASTVYLPGPTPDGTVALPVSSLPPGGTVPLPMGSRRLVQRMEMAHASFAPWLAKSVPVTAKESPGCPLEGDRRIEGAVCAGAGLDMRVVAAATTSVANSNPRPRRTHIG